jgi:hypothetical protein
MVGFPQPPNSALSKALEEIEELKTQLSEAWAWEDRLRRDLDQLRDENRQLKLQVEKKKSLRAWF